MSQQNLDVFCFDIALIFQEHKPLEFTCQRVSKWLKTAENRVRV